MLRNGKLSRRPLLLIGLAAGLLLLVSGILNADPKNLWADCGGNGLCYSAGHIGIGSTGPLSDSQVAIAPVLASASGVPNTVRNNGLDVQGRENGIAIIANLVNPAPNPNVDCHVVDSCSIFIGKLDSITKVRIDGRGAGFFNGGVFTGGADFSESMSTSDDLVTLQPGDVLAIDAENPRTVKKSTEANSRLVAGVYSTKPSILSIGDHHINDSLAGEVPLAVIGIVPTKVTTENGSIHIGDLLVTSSTAGYAMRAPDNPAPGTILGKALANLDSGSGVIEVLMMLR